MTEQPEKVFYLAEDRQTLKDIAKYFYNSRDQEISFVQESRTVISLQEGYQEPQQESGRE